MEKVRITQEQADMIKEINKKFHGMLNLDLIRVIKGEYEVEPEFKAGDWVSVAWMGEVPTIHNITSDISKTHVNIDLSHHNDISNNYPPRSIVKHATPEEITIEKNRRKAMSLSAGTLIYCSGTLYEFVELIKSNEDFPIVVRYYNSGRGNKLRLRADYKILCFAKDRKDIEVKK